MLRGSWGERSGGVGHASTTRCRRGLAGLGLVGLLLLLPPGFALAQASDPAAVMQAYDAARQQRDVEGALALFADEATVSDRAGQTFTGRDEIRRFLTLLTGRGRVMMVANRRVSGDRVAWNERISGPTPRGAESEVGVEAVVQGGKIQLLSYAGGGAFTRPRPTAPDVRPQVPAALGLGSVLLVLGGMVTLLSAGPTTPRPHGAGSRLRGSLLRDLGAWRADQRRATG